MQDYDRILHNKAPELTHRPQTIIFIKYTSIIKTF